MIGINIALIRSLLTFLKSTIIDNEKVRLYFKQRRNEACLTIALFISAAAFFLYYIYSGTIIKQLEEYERRLERQSEFIESVNKLTDDKISRAVSECTIRIEGFTRDIEHKDSLILDQKIRIADLWTLLNASNDNRLELSRELNETLRKCK